MAVQKYGMFGRVDRRKLLLSKKNMAARLRFANWTDETKVEIFGHNAQSHV